MPVCVLSHVQLFATPWTVDCQAPPFMGFPRQEYWSGLPFPSPGNLPEPHMETHISCLAGGFFTTDASGKPYNGILLSHKENETMPFAVT